MRNEPFGIPIRDLAGASTHWKRKIMPDDALHFMPPRGGGWGIIRTALQLPNSIALMAAPPVCARSTGLRELQLDFRDRFFFLNIGEGDFSNGMFESLILKAVDEIMEYLNGAPKVLFFCETCLDDILGSDYKYLQNLVRDKYKIRSSSLHIKPTSADGSRPSGLLSQQSIYNLIRPAEKKDCGINLLGSALPVAKESEFHDVVSKAGVGPVRHLSDCKTLEEFDKMSCSSWNIILHPLARLVADDMQKKYGIPNIRLPWAYSLKNIDAGYCRLEQFLGKQLQTGVYHEEAADFLSGNLKKYSGMTAAVGASIHAGAFELARALTEYGLEVQYIFANMVTDFDSEHLQWLKENMPELMVYTGSHTSMAEFHSLNRTVDIAFGYEAGYFCSGSKTVPLGAEKPYFGYKGIQSLFHEIDWAIDHRAAHREAMYKSFNSRGPQYARFK